MTWSADCGVIALRVVVQQLAQAQRSPGHDGKSQIQVADGEPPGAGGGLDVAAGAGRQSLLRSGERQAVVQQHLAEIGPAAVQPAGEPEALGEHLGGIVDVGGELVQRGAVGVEDVVDGGVEQLLLAVEVVVERAHSDVGGLGDLQDRDVGSPVGDEALGGPHECRAGARLAPLEAVRRLRLAPWSSRSPLLPDFRPAPKYSETSTLKISSEYS